MDGTSIDVWNLANGHQTGQIGAFPSAGAGGTPLFAVSAGDRAVALWAHPVQVAPLTGTAGHLQLAATARAKPAAAGGSFLAILDDQTVATASAKSLVVASPGTPPVTVSPPAGTAFSFLAADTTGRQLIIGLTTPSFALPGYTVDPTQPFDPVHDPVGVPRSSRPALSSGQPNCAPSSACR